MNGMRIAKVSAVQRETGMVSVIYTDQEDSATDYLPFLTYGEEYHPPQVDDIVLVAGLSDGTYSSVVIGTFWNRSNIPPNKKAPWAKGLTDTVGISVENDIVSVQAKDIVLETGGRRISLKGLAGD